MHRPEKCDTTNYSIITSMVSFCAMFKALPWHQKSFSPFSKCWQILYWNGSDNAFNYIFSNKTWRWDIQKDLKFFNVGSVSESSLPPILQRECPHNNDLGGIFAEQINRMACGLKGQVTTHCKWRDVILPSNPTNETMNNVLI